MPSSIGPNCPKAENSPFDQVNKGKTEVAPPFISRKEPNDLKLPPLLVKDRPVLRGVRRWFCVSLVASTTIAVLPASYAQAAPSPAARLLTLVNDARRSAGLPGVAIDSRLSAIASGHAQDMATKGSIYHNPSFPIQAQPWKSCGENVGAGGDADTVHRAFMSSAQHRSNIRNRNYNLVGIGVVSSGGKLWVVEDFVARDGVAPATAPAPPRAARPAPPPTAPPPIEEVIVEVAADASLEPNSLPYCRLVCFVPIDG